MGPSFDNIINKFKASTKQAADQMGKAAKIARLKMDIMTLSGEKNKRLQSIGDITYELYRQRKQLDGTVLLERVKDEFSQIERIEDRTREIEAEILNLQEEIKNQGEGAEEVTDADEVTDVSQSGEEKS